MLTRSRCLVGVARVSTARPSLSALRAPSLLPSSLPAPIIPSHHLSAAPALALSSASSSNSTAPASSAAARSPAPSDNVHLADPLKPTHRFWQRLWDNDWITEEAEYLTALAYRQHRGLMESGLRPADEPEITKEQLERLGEPYSKPARTLGDRLARTLVRALIPFNNFVFKSKYNHHACVLETVAAVPGMVGAMFRHMRSLRTMSRDYGWINPLLEEAENERMHLLTWMKITQPTTFEKLLVLTAQGLYFAAYSVIYVTSPRVAHRFVGYLEEEAVREYTKYLSAIDKGELPNPPAPAIAINYWNLPHDATVRDVVLRVRADECMHRNMNHHLADLHCQKLSLAHPALPVDKFPPTPPTAGKN